MKKTAINFDEWQAALREAQMDRADKVSRGWDRIDVIAEAFGVTETEMRRRLRPIVQSKRAGRRTFKIVTADGSVRSVFHYRLTKT